MNYCIDIYKNFTCIGGDCPDTCCFGWRILLDENTEELYKTVPGAEGRTLRRNVHKMGDHCIKKKLNGRCPYETCDGLCRLQKDGHTEYMPRVCREYPRRILNFGEFTEITLEMACPEIARLVMADPRRLEFVANDESRDTLWTLANDDKGFLESLVGCRTKILDVVWTKELSMSAVMRCIYEYSQGLHEILIKGSAKGIDDVDTRINTYISHLSGDGSSGCSHPESGSLDGGSEYMDSQYLLYKFSTLDKLLTYNIYDPRLKWAVPRLYKRIKSYHQIFDRMTEAQATDFISGKLEEMMAAGLVSMDKYRAYLSFTIQQLFLTAYEDYYVFRPVLLAFAYVQMLMIVDVCTYVSGDSMALDNQILELGSLERRMRHNEATRDGMLERIRKEFVNAK